jgi:hypothetical protein
MRALTKRFTATGGVIWPIARLTVMTTPIQNRIPSQVGHHGDEGGEGEVVDAHRIQKGPEDKPKEVKEGHELPRVRGQVQKGLPHRVHKPVASAVQAKMPAQATMSMTTALETPASTRRR